VPLDSVTEIDIAKNIINEVKEITDVRVISDIKIYGPYDNTNSDVINAITSSLNSNGDGFFIWNFDSLILGSYDIGSIKKAYNPEYYSWYYPTYDSLEDNFSQIFIVIFEFLFATILISVIFFFEWKEKRFSK
jgi:hypothetical protein